MVAVVLSAVMLTGCSSGAKQEAVDPTIPVVTEATVAETVPPPSTSVSTTTTTSTTVEPSVEEQLRAATLAYWAEFRRTALNLDTDDLSTLKSWYVSGAVANEDMQRFVETKAKRETYRRTTKSFETSRVDEVRREDTDSALVTACIADNLVLVALSASGEKVIDDSSSAFLVQTRWQRVGDRWLHERVTSKESLGENERCA